MRQTRTGISLRSVAVSVFALGVLVALLLPFIQAARTPSRRNSCASQLKQLALGLLKYEAEHGSFPPAYTVDAEGNRLHSWRTLILPYIEEEKLYATIDLTKPWDHPANAEARAFDLEYVWCPSVAAKECYTTYLAVVGPNTTLSVPPTAEPPPQVVMLVEVGRAQAVHWMSPEDISVEDFIALRSIKETNHADTFQIAMSDGRVTTYPFEKSDEELRAMVTVAGSEENENQQE